MNSNQSYKIVQTIDYPTLTQSLSFSDYINQCRIMIQNRRQDLTNHDLTPEHVITSNCPFEFLPGPVLKKNNPAKYGVLLIHGLFDSPFSLRDLGHFLSHQGLWCRSILLPGHGTRPSDLLQVSYEDWIEAVRYGIDSFKQKVDHVLLMGYSTGGTLSIYHALQDQAIKAMILLAPAIKIKAPMKTLYRLEQILKLMNHDHNWFYQEKEIDYTKYRSVAIQAVIELFLLTKLIAALQKKSQLTCPLLMVLSQNDETISSKAAAKWFSKLHHPLSRLLSYTAKPSQSLDPRILFRHAQYPDLNIKNISHLAIPFSPNNPHYGKNGDYFKTFGQHSDNLYGAYNRVEAQAYALFYQLGLSKQEKRELTFNPDFDFMSQSIINFIDRLD